MTDVGPLKSTLRIREFVRLRACRALGFEPAPDRYARLRSIEKLDPVEDCWEIQSLILQDFRSVFEFSGMSGLYLTYAYTRISRILIQTRAFVDNVEKRVVDTAILEGTMAIGGLDSEDGRTAVRRMNSMHKRYDIHPDDFVFIGCYFVVYVNNLIDRFGWRPLTDRERTALVHAQMKKGRHMGHGGYPETFEGMKKLYSDMLDEGLAFEPQNKVLADALRPLLSGSGPRPLRPFVRAMHMSTVFDERLVTMCGHRMPNRAVLAFARALVRLYGQLDPIAAGESKRSKQMMANVYPGGFTIEQLGTFPKSSSRKRPQGGEASVADEVGTPTEPDIVRGIGAEGAGAVK